MTTPPEPEVGHTRHLYRLRVSSSALAALSAEWDRCRWVWNACVAAARTAHKAKKPCGPAALDKMLTGWRAEHEWLREGGSVPQQQIIRDFGKSRTKALKDIKERLPMRRRAGMPRFKKKDLAAPTLNYTRRGFRLKDGRLHLAGSISLTVVWSRDLPAEPSSARVYRDAVGHWYASFVVPAQIEALPATGRAIGIDWGIRDIATTTSDAHDLPHAQHGKKAADRLARYQKMMARRKPARGQAASKRYREAKRQAAKAHKKIARQRQDTARKWAKKVVRGHDALAVEDFRPKFLAKSTMARKAADGAISATKSALIEMARKHGRTVHLVNPAHTTMDCGHCGARAKHALPLSERTYTCTACGAVSSRDKNSARVARPGWSHPGWCRRRKTSWSAAPGGCLSQKSPPFREGRKSILNRRRCRNGCRRSPGPVAGGTVGRVRAGRDGGVVCRSVWPPPGMPPVSGWGAPVSGWVPSWSPGGDPDMRGR